LGVRLKALESRWEKVDDPAGRKRAATKLTEMHGKFISMRYGEVCRIIDFAMHFLDHEEPPSAGKQWAMSLAATPERRLLDGSAKELSVTLCQVYPVKGAMPKNLEVQLWFNDRQVTTVKPTDFPTTIKLPLPALGEFKGLDRKLYVLVDAGKTVQVSTVGISQVADLQERLSALKKTTEAWTELDTIEKATAFDRSRQLNSLAKGGIEETDVPAASLLDNADAMLDDKPFFTTAKSGQFWTSIPLGQKKTAPVRVYIPRNLDAKKPVPAVVGLHGAGGSENLFFEGYGGGRAIDECRNRGWIFVATRSGLDFAGAPPVATVLDELARRYPLDAKRTFLVGHSMGAGQAVTLVQKHPSRFAAIACLGGGGIVNDPAPFEKLPVFIGGGEKDFGLGYAKQLRKDLESAGDKHVLFKEYPGVEHMLIARESLPEAFRLFETVAMKPSKP